MIWLVLLAAIQVVLGVRVLVRFARTARGERVAVSQSGQPGRVTIVIPVLDERTRLGACLHGVSRQTSEVKEILVVDGGSRDGTRALVARWATRDARIRLVDASPVPADWTGKAWGLAVGLRHAAADASWILCLDADVRPEPLLARSLLAHACRVGVDAFSVATSQAVSGRFEALVHPALLATLVYRFGIPGRATHDPSRVQANGQCFFARRALLEHTRAFDVARTSLCEDVTIARRLAESGEPVGFYEASNLVAVEMYSGGHEAWSNWPRSLPMRDRYFGWRNALGLIEVAVVQALPIPLFAAAWAFALPGWLVAVNGFLAASRLGVLAGTARAYVRRPWTYWLSPVCDLPVAVRLVTSALRRRHRWRGRLYQRRHAHFRLEERGS